MARNKAVLWQDTWDVCGVQRQLLTGCSLFPAAAALPITVVHHCSCPAWQLSSVLVLQMAFLGWERHGEWRSCGHFESCSS